MSLIAWIGLLTLFLNEETVDRIALPLVAFAAGSLIGGAFLHLLPESIADYGLDIQLFIWLVAGFLLFFILEQFLQWRHCHLAGADDHGAVTYLVLLADGLHNFIGGLAIAGSFLASVPIGIVTWFAAAAHEIPQELGDFGILVHGGWDKRKALVFNFVSALTVVAGGLFAFFASSSINITFLLPFAAGNFIYIAAADLIPEVKHAESLRGRIGYTIALLLGVLIILFVRMVFHL
jgi:zinc and cadmium transporter